jgi:putative DNA primase/helicase
MISASLPEVARQILGAPNPALSTPRELRWGNKGSLCVSIERNRWKDFETGESGDAIDLVQREHACGYLAALEILGIDPDNRPEPARPAARHIDTQSADQNRDRAIALWDASRPAALSPAEAYLRGRSHALGGTLDPDAIRYHPACPFLQERHPALMLLYRDMATYQAVAVQRIPITVDGRRATGPDGKAMAKMTLGPIAGAAMMLTGRWIDSAYVAVCEGPETGIALCNAGERMVWALGGAGNIRAFPLLFDRYPCSLVVFADADQAGQDAARVAAQRYADAGRDALIIRPARDGADFADMAV